MAKRAIVLGGGGARGAYQIGVWRALRELDVRCEIVTGTSVGALNGALMTQGDYHRARELWQTLTGKDVILQADETDLSTRQGRLRALRGLQQFFERGVGLDISPLEKMLLQVVDEQKVRASPIQYGLVTVRFPTFQTVQMSKEEIPEGKLIDYLMASATYFPFFQIRRIGDDRFIDGGYSDNLPAQLALRMGAQELIAVDLKSLGIVHALRVDVPLTYIRSHWDLGPILDFDPVRAENNMRLGYLDTLKAYHRLEGSAYAFLSGESAKNARALRGVLRHIERTSGVSLFRQYKNIPKIHEAWRYNDHRFIRYQGGGYTFGRAVTTAAEIAGELLHIPPDRRYTLAEFNRLLREGASFLLTPARVRTAPRQNSAYRTGRPPSRAAMHRLFAMLLDAVGSGRVPDPFWGLVGVAPREFIAAYYLLALFEQASP